MVDIRTDRRVRRWRRLVAAPVGVAALVSLAACGTGTSADTSAASSGSTPTSAASDAPATVENSTGGPSDSTMAAYRSCLAENGVTLPEPAAAPRSGGGRSPQGAANATPPSGAPAVPGGGGPGGPGGGMAGQAPPGVDAATWAAAEKACADLAPAPPGGAAPSASPGS
jgi:hypothetical protein